MACASRERAIAERLRLRVAQCEESIESLQLEVTKAKACEHAALRQLQVERETFTSTQALYVEKQILDIGREIERTKRHPQHHLPSHEDYCLRCLREFDGARRDQRATTHRASIVSPDDDDKDTKEDNDSGGTTHGTLILTKLLAMARKQLADVGEAGLRREQRLVEADQHIRVLHGIIEARRGGDNHGRLPMAELNHLLGGVSWLRYALGSISTAVSSGREQFAASALHLQHAVERSVTCVARSDDLVAYVGTALQCFIEELQPLMEAARSRHPLRRFITAVPRVAYNGQMEGGGCQDEDAWTGNAPSILAAVGSWFDSFFAADIKRDTQARERERERREEQHRHPTSTPPSQSPLGRTVPSPPSSPRGQRRGARTRSIIPTTLPTEPSLTPVASMRIAPKETPIPDTISLTAEDSFYPDIDEGEDLFTSIGVATEEQCDVFSVPTEDAATNTPVYCSRGVQATPEEMVGPVCDFAAILSQRRRSVASQATGVETATSSTQVSIQTNEASIGRDEAVHSGCQADMSVEVAEDATATTTSFYLRASKSEAKASRAYSYKYVIDFEDSDSNDDEDPLPTIASQEAVTTLGARIEALEERLDMKTSLIRHHLSSADRIRVELQKGRSEIADVQREQAAMSQQLAEAAHRGSLSTASGICAEDLATAAPIFAVVCPHPHYGSAAGPQALLYSRGVSRGGRGETRGGGFSRGGVSSRGSVGIPEPPAANHKARSQVHRTRAKRGKQYNAVKFPLLT